MQLSLLCSLASLAHVLWLILLGQIHLQTIARSRFYWSLLILGLIAIVSLKRKSLSKSGALAAFIIGLPIALCSTPLFCALLAFFVAGTVATNRGSDLKKTYDAEYTQGGRRSASQVFANGWCVAHFAFLALIGGCSQAVAETLGLVALAVTTSDTLSSELAPLISGSPPRLLLRPWRTVPRGTNGAVTVAGLLLSLCGGLIVGAAYKLVGGHASLFSWRLLIAAGFFGSVIDSVLGQLCQATYLTKDGRVIDRRTEEKPILICGSDVLSGSSVNLVSVVSTVGLVLVALMTDKTLL